MKVQIRQIRSAISSPENQKRNIKALGLGKLHRVVEVEYTPEVKGQVNKVRHLVEITEVA